MLTTELLCAGMGLPPKLSRIEPFVVPLDAAMQQFEINTPLRAAAFLANIAHESGRYRYLREIWGPTPAQLRYEGRKDLGNTHAGDGFKYRGRGLIQVTGRFNYTRTSKALFGDDHVLLDNPELLERPEYATLSAAEFWASNGINAVADTANFDAVCDKVNIGRITAKVGDSNGYAERLVMFTAYFKALS